jgi:hemolysin III
MTSLARPPDEMANVVTHGLGFVLSIAGSAYLLSVVKDRPRVTIIACGVYCLTLLLLYASSTLSHAFHEIEWRRWYRMLDQASIFLLIAGSYTPFGVTLLGHGWWRLLLVGMWVLALIGVVRVLQVRDLTPRTKITYGLMGWLPVFALGELARQSQPRLLLWVIAGGLFYTAGAIFLRLSSTHRYAHAVWHMFVMAGSACHYAAILIAVTR